MGTFLLLNATANTAPLTNDVDINEKFAFKRYFFNSRLRNKFFILVFLPFVPIYTVSRYFYERNIQKGKKPNLKKYLAIISVLYLITLYPLILGLLWVYSQIFFFPLSFGVAYYYHRRGYKEESEEEEEKIYNEKSGTVLSSTYKENFVIQKFKKLSLTFVVLLVFTLIFTDFFIFFIFTFMAVVLILFPKLYEKPLGVIPQRLLILSNPILGFFSFIPGLDFQGTWFMLHEPQSIKLKSIKDLIKFVGKNAFPFFIMNVGITALIMRIVFWLKGDPSTTTLSAIVSSSLIALIGYLISFEIIPIVLAIYFVWIWTWQDAGLRIAIMKNRKRFNSKQTHDHEEEIILIKDPTSSIKYLFSLLFGFPSITWLGTKLFVNNSSSSPFINSAFDLAFVLVIFFIVTGTSIIFMGVMYYRSGYHEKNVSNLRNFINSLDETAPYFIARYQPILRPIHTISRPNISSVPVFANQNDLGQQD